MSMKTIKVFTNCIFNSNYQGICVYFPNNEGINTIYTINSAVDMSPPPEECPISSGTVYNITSRVTWGTPLHTVNNEICLSDWR